MMGPSRCDRIRKRLGSYLDGELPEGDARQIEEHLAGCGRCRQELEEIRRAEAFFKEASALEGAEPPGRDYWEGFLPRLRERLRAAPRRPPGRFGWRFWPRLSPVSPRLGAAIGGVAVAVFTLLLIIFHEQPMRLVGPWEPETRRAQLREEAPPPAPGSVPAPGHTPAPGTVPAPGHTPETAESTPIAAPPAPSPGPEASHLAEESAPSGAATGLGPSADAAGGGKAPEAPPAVVEEVTEGPEPSTMAAAPLTRAEDKKKGEGNLPGMEMPPRDAEAGEKSKPVMAVRSRLAADATGAHPSGGALEAAAKQERALYLAAAADSSMARARQALALLDSIETDALGKDEMPDYASVLPLLEEAAAFSLPDSLAREVQAALARVRGAAPEDSTGNHRE